MSHPNVLVILSGCGVFDGSEIHESVITLLHLDRHDAKITFAAPDVEQMHVVDHHAGKPTTEKRNVRVESARIARGPVQDIAEVHGDQFDAVIFPGGFGAAKNLCSFATKGHECEVNLEVSRVLQEAHEACRPIGLICISPTIGAKVFPGCTVTIGCDPATADAIKKMGSHHQPRHTNEVCIDETHRIVSTPAYMSAKRIGQVHEGIGRLVDQVMKMVDQPVAAGTAGHRH